MNNKHVFWQSLVVALIIFWTGIILGVMFENSRADKLQQFYLNTETEIFDLNLKNVLLTQSNVSCDLSLKENINFADQIYNEAKQLEKYDSSTKISTEIASLHRRYDLLRVMLWNSMINLNQNCNNKVNVVVYLYQYNNPSIETKAKQGVMSQVLLDLKDKFGDKIILIPIAYDSDVSSLKLLEEKYNLTSFPVVFINQNYKIYNLETEKDIEKYLNNI